MNSLVQEQLLEFPEEARCLLSNAFQNGPVLPADITQNVVQLLGIEIGHLMIRLLPIAAAYARVPISSFNVGAVALGTPAGNLYLGANMEFPGQALSFCMHGEQSATNNAWLHGEEGLRALAINAAPCGYCRQFLYELTTARQDFNILLKKNKDPNDFSYTMDPLAYFLPNAFGPSDLGLKGGLMQPENHNLTIQSSEPIAIQALSGANASYAPYTKNYSGVALQDSRGAFYVGRYAENAAYNPSLSPLESALGYMNMNVVAQVPFDIVDAALVEAPSKASQRSATENVLASVAPRVVLKYFAAT